MKGYSIEPFSTSGDLMTVEQFLDSIVCYIDYDGWGYLATDKGQSQVIIIQPSYATEILEANPWATHVMWFNR